MSERLSKRQIKEMKQAAHWGDDGDNSPLVFSDVERLARQALDDMERIASAEEVIKAWETYQSYPPDDVGRDEDIVLRLQELRRLLVDAAHAHRARWPGEDDE